MSGEWQRSRGARPLVLGHRGTRNKSTENTLRSFEQAVAEGGDGIEFDVRLDADDRIVVFHDPTLSRMTLGRDCRAIETIPSRELDRVLVGDGEPIPTLDDVLLWARSRNTRLNIEVKATLSRPASLVAMLHRTLRHAARGLPVLISSFDPRLLAQLRALDPDLCLGWLVELEEFCDARHCAWERLGARAVCAAFPLLSPERIASWKAAGATLAAWTVNDDAVAERLAASNVDIIITDSPGSVRRAVEASHLPTAGQSVQSGHTAPRGP